MVRSTHFVYGRYAGTSFFDQEANCDFRTLETRVVQWCVLILRLLLSGKGRLLGNTYRIKAVDRNACFDDEIPGDLLLSHRARQMQRGEALIRHHQRIYVSFFH